MTDCHLLPMVQELVNTAVKLLQHARDIEQLLLQSEENRAATTATATMLLATLSEHQKAGATNTLNANKSRAPLSEAEMAEATLSRCRACNADVLRLEGDATVYDLKGEEHATSCAMKHVVCNSAR